MKALASFLIALAGTPGADDAEDLFRTMERKLRAARTLRIECSVTAEREPPFRAWLLLAGGNRVNAGVDKIVRPPRFRNIVSDGKEVRAHAMGLPPKRKAAPENLAANVLAFAVRYDFFEAIHVGAATGWLLEGSDLESRVKLSGFTMGPAEKIGDRAAQAVEFTREVETSPDKPPERARVTLWIDRESSLPLRRNVTPEKGTPVIETFTTVAIDKDIDPDRFLLPRD